MLNAKKNGRSLNSEIIARLEASFADPSDSIPTIEVVRWMMCRDCRQEAREALARLEALPYSQENEQAILDARDDLATWDFVVKKTGINASFRQVATQRVRSEKILTRQRSE